MKHHCTVHTITKEQNMTGLKSHWILSSLMGSLLLAGCSLAPEYQPAKVIIPLQFKEAMLN
jgi:multidrug efflux system outer membrane protein